ncbi:MAG: single-stranded-DNA-specific exonuclease RecJ [Anaerolineales bacterium]
MRKRWQIASPLTPDAERELAAFPFPLRQILFNRGYATEAEARAFLQPERSFPDPGYPLDVEAAVERILYARRQHQKVIVYGDYDVDGVTATALLLEVLQRLDIAAESYIPNRFDEGYGLNVDALRELKEGGTDLVISVDCGIRSLEEAEFARRIGLDLIITDHHHPGEALPQALAVINPKRADDPYPEKQLAGVGLAWKLAQALIERTAKEPDFSLLELVALGTVADLAPLNGENRLLVRGGLKALRQTRRPGLLSLAKLAGLNLATTTATDIGFILGPRLNAAGRLESALDALHLLLTQDVFQAGLFAQRLESQNRQRQALTRAIQAEAEKLALERAGEGEVPPLLFAAHPEFNIGVVGLAAARLSERHYRPAIVARQDAETTRGSCRSIPEFHITEALDQCADLLLHYGGHAAAAGFTLLNRNLPEFIERISWLAEQALAGKDLRPTLWADVEVPLSQMGPEVWKQLQYLQPTGYGNPEATFVSRDVRVRQVRAVGAEGHHLKLTLEDERGVLWDAIGFRLGEMQTQILPGDRVDILYTLEINEYNGRRTLQINLKDVVK